ncbi:regulatory protein RecX [Rhizobium leguminosarum]|jgi:regulatory protein|uniref:regulatory protein RecX n=1 Tax=Rhizobium leguminosarum TaxID=384 RepID=UPI002E1327A9|nr:regulatory protein RecX [Rhizobium leguminosarum]
MTSERPDQSEEEVAAKSFITDRSLLWAKRSAIYTLSQRSVSTEALRKKIVERAVRKYDGIEPSEAEKLAAAAVAFCTDNGFLDDQSFAEYRVAEGVRKGHSRRKIEMTLADKGVARDDAAGAVIDVDDVESAMNLAQKKGYGPFRRGDADQKRIAREAAAFARNGFSSEITWKIVRMSPDDLGD